MASKTFNRAPGTKFEYFLYATIVLETAAAAYIFKLVSREAELFLFKTWVGILYFCFLTWTVFQLHILHRKRRRWQETVDQEPVDAGEKIPNETPAPNPESPEQLQPVETTRPVLGLTGAQLTIALVVFVAALMAFRWVLVTIHPGQ